MFHQKQPIGRMVNAHAPLERMTGDQFRQWRLYMNLTQVELARILKIHFITLSRWERRRWREIPPMAIRRIADVVDPKASLTEE